MLYFIKLYIAPGVVEIFEVISTFSNGTVVIWNPPTEPNGIITGYEVMYSEYGGTSMNVIGPLESNVTTLDLTDLSKLNLATYSY